LSGSIRYAGMGSTQRKRVSKSRELVSEKEHLISII
jgi:hypothetical protein